jgi:hypothetical protein
MGEPENQQRLLEIADAFDEEAMAADWLAGDAESKGQAEKAAEIRGDAATMRRWATLNRDIWRASEN